MNYIKFKILKTELLIKFNLKSNTTYLLEFVNQYYFRLYFNSKNNLQIELNSNLKYYDFYSLRQGYPSIKNAHHLMCTYYRQLIHN